jgi:hypothetical protein
MVDICVFSAYADLSYESLMHGVSCSPYASYYSVKWGIIENSVLNAENLVSQVKR